MACYKPILRTVKSQQLFLPCGQCIGCRLERSRQWAIRCTHEASQHEDNCFITLTYDSNTVPQVFDETVQTSLFPVYTLNSVHLRNFFKRLRHKVNHFSYYSCGEYGDRTERPHYHACLFGINFPDRIPFRQSPEGFFYYRSSILESCWEYGHSMVADYSFETAAYVARYCTKKITGKMAEDHYSGREPEFARMSKNPAIGKNWLQKYSSDIYNYDTMVIRDGIQSRPPRYYDKLFDLTNPDRMEEIKSNRVDRAAKFFEGWERLETKHEIKKLKFKQLKRSFENAESV